MLRNYSFMKFACLVAISAVLCPVAALAQSGAWTTSLLSMTPSGTGGNDASGKPPVVSHTFDGLVVLTQDGRYAAFASVATDLDPYVSDCTDTIDLFLRDRQTGETTCVSVLDGMTFGALRSCDPDLEYMGEQFDIAEDADYIYVAFAAAGYFVLDMDPNAILTHSSEIYVAIVSKEPLGLVGVSVPTHELPVSLYDRGKEHFYDRYLTPSLSITDARGFRMAFVADLNPWNIQERSAAARDGVSGPESAVYVMYDVDVWTNFPFPDNSNHVEAVSVYATSDSTDDAYPDVWSAGDTNPFAACSRISRDGRYVAFVGHTGPECEGCWDSAWGRIFSQRNDPTNFWNAYADFHPSVLVRDLDCSGEWWTDWNCYFVASLPDGVSVPGGLADVPNAACGMDGVYDPQFMWAWLQPRGFDISGDGRRIVFRSRATNLVADDLGSAADELYYRDLDSGSTRLITKGYDPNHPVTLFASMHPSMSLDGSRVVFFSEDENLVPGDAAGKNIFLWQRDTDEISQVDVPYAPPPGSGMDSEYGVISGDGHVIAFSSDCDCLVPEDTSFATWDVYACVEGCPGCPDFDGDGDVDLADLSVLLGHYGQNEDVSWGDGDANCDGSVNLADLSMVLGVYGSVCP